MIFKYNLDWGNLKTSTLSISISLAFLIYFSIIWRLSWEVTLLIMITIPAWSTHMKSAITFGFNILQGSVDISNIVTRRFYKSWLVLIAHRNNDLFPRWTLCCHVYFWLGLTFTIDNFLNVFYFFCL